MLTIKSGNMTTEKWFSHRLSMMDAFGFTVYKQVPRTKNVLGFIKDPFYTILIDLTKDEAVIFSHFAHQTRSQINQFEKLGYEVSTTSNQDFINFYNVFAGVKDLPLISRNRLAKYKGHMVFTQIKHDGITLAMHAYLLDHQSKRVRCNYSASHRLINPDKELQKTIGQANRTLHWCDMKYFKQQGFKIYDFAGYSTDPQNKSLQFVNQFKKGFGKTIVEENIYHSIPAFIMTTYRDIKNKIRR